MSTAAAAANVAGSDGAVPESIDASTRVAATAAVPPRIAPRPAMTAPWRITSQTIA